jgi:hypothetical protein
VRAGVSALSSTTKLWNSGQIARVPSGTELPSDESDIRVPLGRGGRRGRCGLCRVQAGWWVGARGQWAHFVRVFVFRASSWLR